MVFVAILVPVAARAVMVANRAGVVADHKRVAAHLADRILNEMIVTDEWRTTARQGDFGEDWPGYRWEISDEAWDVEPMRLVTVEVFFEAQGNEYTVRLSTLVDDEQEQTTQ